MSTLWSSAIGRSWLVALLAGTLLVPTVSVGAAHAASPRSEGTWTYGGYTLRPPANPQATGLPEDVVAAAREVRKRAAQLDRDITKQVIDIANGQGARLEGLDFRLKSEQSIARKVAERAAETGADPLTVAQGLSDITRYTMTFPRDSYVEAVNGALRDLETAGNALRTKNYWKQGDRYQGINVAMTTPEGIKVELQFHTPRSLKVKEDTHGLYEKFRVSTDNSERWKLFKQIVRASMSIPMPSWKVFSIGSLEYSRFETLS